MQNLKSAEEMEEEEREAQSAKLQELIRRGSPEDLREANQLMKVMAGFDTRSKVDYRAKAAEDVGKIQQKARLLEERLAQFKPGDKMTDGDVFSELAAALSSAQPKIQKMCEEESDDHEAVAKLLEINDSIHRTVERYKLLKKGDIEGANRIASGAPFQATPASGPGNSSANELSLIDLDAEADTNGSVSAGQGASQTSGIENDLLGLSMGESSSYGRPGGIALGFGANISKLLDLQVSFRISANTTIVDIPGGPLLSSITDHSTAKGPVSAGTPTPPNAFSQFSSFTSAPASQSTTPQPPAASRSAFSPPPTGAIVEDPFAALGSLGSLKSSTPAPAPAANDDDEWSFSSALPPEAAPALPREQRAIVNNTNLKIDLIANRTVDTAPSINLLFSFTNNTAQPVSELHFQLAVTKVCAIRQLDQGWQLRQLQGYELQLSPQTGRSLAPKQSAGVTQSISVFRTNNKAEKVKSIKLRWRVSYKVGGEVRNEMGEIPEFSLA